MRTLEFKTSYEEMISRIPGLFAYWEKDEAGNAVLHKATDSPMGCYGKVIENIRTPYGWNVVTVDENGNETILIKENTVYTYKFLIGTYYKYLYEEEKPEGFDSFKRFFEDGIGKVEVDYVGLDRKENDLVPNFVYLAVAKSLYNEMLRLQARCRFYEEHKDGKDEEIDKETELSLCCTCVLYNRKGGDKMTEFLKDLIPEAEARAAQWLEEAKGIDKPLTLNYSVSLFSSENDLGIVSPLKNKEAEEPQKTAFDIGFVTNSKLKSLRRFKTYVNQYDVEERPESDKDWLFYYRVGQVRNLSVLNDDFGNILTEETKIDNINVGDKVDDLLAYGDMIESITRDTVEKTITFVYWTDVHLIATCNRVKYDDDNNKKVTYDNFVIDGHDVLHGVRYAETYSYDEGSELDKVEANVFDSYIRGDNDGENTDYEYMPYEKYEFSLYNNMKKDNRTVGYNKAVFNTVSTNSANIAVEREQTREDENLEETQLIHQEFYVGVPYSPSEKIDVNIGRGITSVFDMHIRLSEVKSLQDMEEFSNGSFFVMQE